MNDPKRDGEIVRLAIEGKTPSEIAKIVKMTRCGVRHAVKVRLAERIEQEGGGVSNFDTRLCRVCGIFRSRSEFNRNKKYKDGLDRKCKHCQREYDEARPDRAERRATLYAYAKTRPRDYWRND